MFFSNHSMELRHSIDFKDLKSYLKNEILVWEEIKVRYA